ncbi:MAG: GNAT family N-acetyltransferase [Desulfovibrio sp.]|uniref:GNAT family N-acetyltransferase n=1 Tax=Desulfovibrio sp. 7SRBS1 TaxID=3378064 RepID=UPI003B3C6A67
MKIQRAVVEDHPEILAVWEASVRATHDFLAEEDIVFFRPLVREGLGAVDVYCGKDASGRILGFLGVAGEGIEMLFMAPDIRGKGLGKQLLAYAVEVLHTTKVDVNEQNPQALGFYEHMGFEVADRSPVDGSGKPFPLLHMRLKKAS